MQLPLLFMVTAKKVTITDMENELKTRLVKDER